MKLFPFFILVVFLAGCAGSPTHVHMLEQGGAIRTEKVEGENYDYKVFIRNTIDFGWDGGERADREKGIQSLFKDKCQKAEILDEAPVQTGTYALGKPAITWVMKIKCNS